MRKTIFAILATTALLSTGMFGTRVEAMTPASLGVAAPNADLVQQAAVVCGPRGCVHRPTPIRRPLWNQWGGGWGGGWYKWWLGWWLEHLEWMPTWLDETGWKMRTLPIWMVRQAANLLTC